MEGYFEVRGLDHIEDMVAMRARANIVYEDIIHSDREMTDDRINLVTQIVKLRDMTDEHIESGIRLINQMLALIETVED